MPSKKKEVVKVEEQKVEEIKEEPEVVEPEVKTPKKKKEKKIEKKVKEKVEKKVEKKVDEEDNEEEKGGKRTFKCYYDDNKILIDDHDKEKMFGRFKGIRPRQAANKAFSSICKKLLKGGEEIFNKDFIFTIVECTRNAKKNRKFPYIGRKEKLDKVSEREVKIGGGKETRKIVYKSKNIIKKYIVNEKA